MKSYKGLLLILLTSIILLPACKKDALPMGDFEPGLALTFDDAYLDKWAGLLPMFTKYGVHASFFICTSCTDSPLNKSLIEEISAAGNEIGCHSSHHPYLKTFLKSQSMDDYYKLEVSPSVQYFDSLNIPVTSFAYPYGERTAGSDRFLSHYFQKIRGITSIGPSETGAYIIHRDQTFVFGAYIDRASHMSLANFKSAILRAKQHNAVLVLIGHSPELNSENDWSFSVSLLDSICNFTVQQKMKFYRLRDI